MEIAVLARLERTRADFVRPRIRSDPQSAAIPFSDFRSGRVDLLNSRLLHSGCMGRGPGCHLPRVNAV